MTKVAVVHEWVQSRAGSEQVFEQLANIWPEADLFALSIEPGVDLSVGGRGITTTVLDRPNLRNRRGLTLPLMPFAWSRLSGSYDLVVTSHHAMAITNRLAKPGTGRHYAYVHSPARYVWTPEIDGRGRAGALALPRALLRRAEGGAAQHLDGIAANSKEVAGRIERFWGRQATVIHPPIDTEFFHLPEEPRSRRYLLALGRFIAYKNHLMVIDVAEAAGIPAVIAGHGALEGQLRERAQRANVPVEVRVAPGREEVRELYQGALALVFPTVEDFGMVPVEAQACGTPVLALAAGGALETVDHLVTGYLAEDLSVSSFLQGIEACEDIRPPDCRRQAERFSPAVFEAAVHEWVHA